jgi:hypothetical protein
MTSTWITLNVGGLKMETDMSTLQFVPDSKLANMFDPDSSPDPARSKDEAFLINTNPDNFKVILDWLRYRKIKLVPAVGAVDNLLAPSDLFWVVISLCTIYYFLTSFLVRN